MKFYAKTKKKGFSLVEVLIACSIISLTSLALMSAASKGIELSNRALRQVQATQLMEEGVEAVKTIRDADWNTISTLSLETAYYLSFNVGINTWSLSTTPVSKIDDIFDRTITVSQVNRDVDGDIALSGTLDAGTKKVNVIVSWQGPGNIISKNIIFYLSNIFN